MAVAGGQYVLSEGGIPTPKNDSNPFEPICPERE